MKRITVYADFDFLATPQEFGTLGYEHVRVKDHFVFEYSHEWLKQLILDKPKAFHGTMAKYGKFRNANNYIVMAEKRTDADNSNFDWV